MEGVQKNKSTPRIPSLRLVDLLCCSVHLHMSRPSHQRPASMVHHILQLFLDACEVERGNDNSVGVFRPAEGGREEGGREGGVEGAF